MPAGRFITLRQLRDSTRFAEASPEQQSEAEARWFEYANRHGREVYGEGWKPELLVKVAAEDPATVPQPTGMQKAAAVADDVARYGAQWTHQMPRQAVAGTLEGLAGLYRMPGYAAGELGLDGTGNGPFEGAQRKLELLERLAGTRGHPDVTGGVAQWVGKTSRGMSETFGPYLEDLAQKVAGEPGPSMTQRAMSGDWPGAALEAGKLLARNTPQLAAQALALSAGAPQGAILGTQAVMSAAQKMAQLADRPDMSRLAKSANAAGTGAFEYGGEKATMGWMGKALGERSALEVLEAAAKRGLWPKAGTVLGTGAREAGGEVFTQAGQNVTDVATGRREPGMSVAEQLVNNIPESAVAGFGLGGGAMGLHVGTLSRALEAERNRLRLMGVPEDVVRNLGRGRPPEVKGLKRTAPEPGEDGGPPGPEERQAEARPSGMRQPAVPEAEEVARPGPGPMRPMGPIGRMGQMGGEEATALPAVPETALPEVRPVEGQQPPPLAPVAGQEAEPGPGGRKRVALVAPVGQAADEAAAPLEELTPTVARKRKASRKRRPVDERLANARSDLLHKIRVSGDMRLANGKISEEWTRAIPAQFRAAPEDPSALTADQALLYLQEIGVAKRGEDLLADLGRYLQGPVRREQGERGPTYVRAADVQVGETFKGAEGEQETVVERTNAGRIVTADGETRTYDPKEYVTEQGSIKQATEQELAAAKARSVELPAAPAPGSEPDGQAGPGDESFSMRRPGQGPRVGRGLTVQAAEAEARARFPELSRRGLVQVVESAEQMPAGIVEQARARGYSADDIEGAYHEGRVWVNARAIPSRARLAEVLGHEGTHYGLAALVGHKRLQRIVLSLRQDAEAGGLVRELAVRYGIDLGTPEGAEELLARIGENRLAQPGLWRRAVAAIRRALREAGLVRTWTENDVLALVTGAGRAARAGRAVAPSEGAKLSTRRGREPAGQALLPGGQALLNDVERERFRTYAQGVAGLAPVERPGTVDELRQNHAVAVAKTELRQIDGPGYDAAAGWKRVQEALNAKAPAQAVKPRQAEQPGLFGEEARLGELGMRFSFAGRRALELMPLEEREKASRNLDAAEKMKARGWEQNRIRVNTGWFQGTDGQWRFEVDDSGARWRTVGETLEAEEWNAVGQNADTPVLRFATEQFPKTLSEIMDHPELFRVYPLLRDVEVVVEPVYSRRRPDGQLETGGRRGSYEPEYNRIMLYGTDNAQLRRTLLHEVQHAVQDYEHMAKGGSPEAMAKEGREDALGAYRNLAGESEARDVSRRAELTAYGRQTMRPEALEEGARERQIVRFSTRGSRTLRDVERKLPVVPLGGRQVDVRGSRSIRDVMADARAAYDAWPDEVRDRNGTRVVLHHEKQDVYAHVTREGRSGMFDRNKARWVPLVPVTVEQASVRILDEGRVLYVARYDNGFRHVVVVDAYGGVMDQGDAGYLFTQYGERLGSPGRRSGLVVENLGDRQPLADPGAGASGSSRTSPARSGMEQGHRDGTTGPAEVKPRTDADGQGREGEGGAKFSIKAWHGTPHTWEPSEGHPLGRPSLQKIGTGEGAQAYGWGLYFAQNRHVAEHYRHKLTKHPRQFVPDAWDEDLTALVDGKTPPRHSMEELYARIWQVNDGDWQRAVESLQDEDAQYGDDSTVMIRWLQENHHRLSFPKGNLYQMEMASDEDQLLDWDKPLSEQSPYVQERLQGMRPADDRNPTGRTLYRSLGGDRKASEQLRDAGVPGIRYLDHGSRAAGDGTRNYVLFDDTLVRTEARFSVRPDGDRDGGPDLEPIKVRGGLSKTLAEIVEEAKKRAAMRKLDVSVEWTVDKAIKLRTKEEGLRDLDWLVGAAHRLAFMQGLAAAAKTDDVRERLLMSELSALMGKERADTMRIAAKYDVPLLVDALTKEVHEQLHSTYARRVRAIWDRYRPKSDLVRNPLLAQMAGGPDHGPQAAMGQWLQDTGLPVEAGRRRRFGQDTELELGLGPAGRGDPVERKALETLKGMDFERLKTLYEQAMQTIRASRTEKEMVVGGRKMAAERVAAELVSEVEGTVPKTLVQGQGKGVAPQHRDMVHLLAVDGYAGGETKALATFGGREALGYRVFYEDLRAGETRAKTVEAAARRKLDGLLEKHGMTEDRRLRMERDQKPVRVGEKTWHLTDAERMYFAALWERAEAREKLLRNGWLLDRGRGTGAYYVGVTREAQPDFGLRVAENEAVAAAILKTVTPAERAVVDGMVEVLSGFGEEANRVSRELWGYDAFTEKRYFGMVAERPALGADALDDPGFGTRVLEGLGFTKATVHSVAPLRVGSVFAQAEEHTRMMGRYIGLTLPIRRLLSTLEATPTGGRRGALSQVLAERMGTRYMRDLRHMLVDLAGLGDTTGNWMNTLTGNAAKAILAWNPGSYVANRYGGSLLYASELAHRDPELAMKFLAAAAAPTLLDSAAGKADLGYLMENGYLWDRWTSDVSRIYVPTLAERAKGGDPQGTKRAALRKWQQKALAPMKWAEQANALALFRTLVGSGMSREAAREKVEKLTRSTQNSTSALDESAWLRAVRKSGWGGLFPFMSQAVVARNLVVRDWLERDWGGLALSLLGLAGSAAVSLASGELRRLLTGRRDRKEGETKVRLAVNAAGNALDLLAPGSGKLLDAVVESVRGYGGGGMMLIEGPLQKVVSGPVQIGKRVWGGKGVPAKLVIDCANAVGQLAGLPTGGPAWGAQVLFQAGRPEKKARKSGGWGNEWPGMAGWAPGGDPLAALDRRLEQLDPLKRLERRMNRLEGGRLGQEAPPYR